MFEKGIYLFIFIVLSLMLMFITIIIAIVRRKNKKVRYCCIILSSIFFVSFIGISIYTTKKVVHVLFENGEKTAHNMVTALGEHLSAQHPSSHFMDSIKNMQPSDVEIPIPYFHCAGFKDYYRTPIIYPYALVSIDNLDKGTITDETGLENIYEESNKSKTLISNINKIYFNKDILITESINNKQDTVFDILKFRNKQKINFDNRAAFQSFLHEERIDSIKLISVKDYYYKF